MATVMSDRFSGSGTFAGDSVYSGLLGTAPTYVSDARYGVGLQFGAATSGTMDQTFTATSQRVFDRICLISATPTAACDFLETRTGANTCKAGVSNIGKLQLKNAAGTSLATGTSTNTLPIGTKFRLVINMNGTSLTAVIYNNDTDTTVLENLNPSGTIVSASPTISREGFITAGGMGVGVAFTMYWPQDGDTVETGVRSLWEPGQQLQRHRIYIPLRSRRATPSTPVVAQTIVPPPYPIAAVSAQRHRYLRPPRRVDVLPVQPQVFIPYPLQAVKSQRPRYVRPARRVTFIPEPQHGIPVRRFLSTVRNRNFRPARHRGANVVPPPTITPYVLQSVPAKRPRGLVVRRIRGAVPVQAQIVVPIPIWTPQPVTVHRLRGALRRKGGSGTPIPSQVVLPPTYTPQGTDSQRARPSRVIRRKRGATFVPAQIVLVAPSFTPQAVTKRFRGLLARARRGSSANWLALQFFAPRDITLEPGVVDDPWLFGDVDPAWSPDQAQPDTAWVAGEVDGEWLIGNADG